MLAFETNGLGLPCTKRLISYHICTCPVGLPRDGERRQHAQDAAILSKSQRIITGSSHCLRPNS